MCIRDSPDSSLFGATNAPSCTARYELIIHKIDNGPYIDFNLLKSFYRKFSEAHVVCLIDTTDSKFVQKLVNAGARGLVPSSASSDEFLAVLQLVKAGGAYLPTELFQFQNENLVVRSSGMIGEPRSFIPVGSQMEDEILTNYALTNRQKEVLGYLCEGRSNKVISTIMGLSINTVKAHLSSIFRVLEVKSRTEAVALLKQKQPQTSSLQSNR